MLNQTLEHYNQNVKRLYFSVTLLNFQSNKKIQQKSCPTKNYIIAKLI